MRNVLRSGCFAMGLLGNLKLVSLAMAKPCTTSCANNAPTCHIGAARTVEGGTILTHTHCYFCGLRCSSLHVIKLLKAYVKEDQSKVPYVANLVQATHSSKKKAMHFIEAMRDMESRAGTLCAATLKLSGNVECDGTSLGKFYVGQGCVRFQKEILNIQQKEINAGRTPPKSLCVHIQCLGAFQRAGPAVLHLSGPRAS